MSDSDREGLFGRIAELLTGFGLAYSHVAESIRQGRIYDGSASRVTPHIRAAYGGQLIVNGGYD